MLLRDALGETLRHARVDQKRTLRDVSNAAKVSLGYLSEVERGRKEASSELLAAICDALDLEIADVLDSASTTIRDSRVTEPVLAGAAHRAPGASGADSLRIVMPYRRTPSASSLA